MAQMYLRPILSAEKFSPIKCPQTYYRTYVETKLPLPLNIFFAFFFLRI